MDELSKCIARDAAQVNSLGFGTFVQQRRGPGDFASLKKVRGHPAHHLLKHYKNHGAPVALRTAPWTRQQIAEAMTRGSHKSALEYLDFLREEMKDMVEKAQWTVLPYHIASQLKNLRISPLGVVPQHGRRPRTIVDYTFSGVNFETLDQIGRAHV